MPYAEGASKEHDMVRDHYFGIVIAGPYDNIQFALEGIDISIHANNHQIAEVSMGPAVIVPLPLIPWPPGIVDLFRLSKEAPPPLILEIRLDPEGEEFSFNPMRVTLEQNKKKVSPGRFRGPAPGIRYGGRWPCRWRDKSQSPDDKGELIHLFQWTCFRLEFDIPSSPTQDFILSISGLEKAGSRVDVPLVHFKKGVSWRIVTVP